MNIQAKSIRAFIGCRNYDLSRAFYRDLGFEEIMTSENMCYFRVGAFGFYLQDAYVKDWVDNSMVFLEVNHLEDHLEALKALGLTEKYKNVRLSQIVHNDWGSEFFLHDPSGILWHFGNFNPKT